MNTKLNTMAIITIGLTLMLSSIGANAVTLDEAKALCANQARLAAINNDAPNAVAFNEGHAVLNGTATTLSVESRGRITVARNNASAARQTAIAETMDMILVKAGGSDTQATGGVNRCSHRIQRGARASQVCGRSKEEHVKVGNFVLCPDDLCAKCGKSPQAHHWVEGNGLLCRISTEESEVKVAQLTLPPIVVVGGAASPPPTVPLPTAPAVTHVAPAATPAPAPKKVFEKMPPKRDP